MAFRKKRKEPFKEIQACLQKRDYKGALDWFNTLLQKDPKNTQIRLRFADTLVLAGSKKEAVKQLRVVADELADKGFMIRAIAINKKILQIDPRQTDVHEKLAEMKEERSSSATSTSGPTLAEALRQPDAPIRRASEEVPPPPAPTQAPPPPREDLPQTLPDLEESMAMEFGDTGEMPAPATETLEPAPPDQPPASRGFELTEEAAPPAAELTPVTEAPLDAHPSFTEEPIELGAGPEPEPEILTVDADTEEPAVEQSFDGIEEPPSSPEIVLEVDQPEEVPSEEVIVAGEEMEVIEFEAESEPEMAAEGSDPLVGVLGEDIDSLIDSIIDDVGSSAKGEQPTEDEPPTHIPLFSDLTTPEFIDVALLLVRRVLKVGEQAVLEGEPGDSMFIISTGEVRATVERDGRQVPVATLRDGDFFGEMAVLSGEPRTATVTAVKSTEVLELSRDNLREICSRHPHVEAKIRLAYDERMASDRGR
ncbi:MAG: hypothetical protein BMS9Abin37_0193 [Acidobacteriota bacterium]|nr:MAG: hypothetical protein BMS9Abin37_0193 [Acidobacteriota bacterium]